MICRHCNNGQKLDVAGLNEIVVLVDRSETELTEVALNTWRPHLDGPPHSHDQKEQIFFVTGGRGQVRIGKETYEAQPGDLFYVPLGTPHQTINQGGIPLEYLLFNAFLDSGKEGHSSFAEHVEKVKGTRKIQADRQQEGPHAGNLSSPASRAQGRRISGFINSKAAQSRPFSRVLLLSRAETLRSEAECLFWAPGVIDSQEIPQHTEQTIFVLDGSATLTVGGEASPVGHGFVAFFPGNSVYTVKTGAKGLSCLSISTGLLQSGSPWSNRADASVQPIPGS